MTTVTYQLTKRELIRTGTVRRLFRARILVAMSIVSVGSIILILMGGSLSIVGWCFLVFVMLFPFIMTRAVQKVIDANPILSSAITLSFGDFGIILVADGVRSEQTWDSFDSWSHSKNYCFLHTDKLGTAITVPKRAFTETQLKTFFEQLSHIDGKLVSATNET